MFSGAGGFEIGIQYANDLSNTEGIQQMGTSQDITSDQQKLMGAKQLTCVGFSEIDKYASAVLAYRFPNIKNYGDCTKINWSEVPDFNLLVGGSPCQDLSIAGKRGGLQESRSGLFYEFIRAVKEKKPSYFIWENVKGALSSNRGWDFSAVINEMAEAGYSLWWQVLNAKDFGVPQNRERIFVVGTRNGSPREIFFERGADEEDSRTIGEDVAFTIDANYHKGTNRIDKGRRSIVCVNNPKHSNDRVYSDEGIAPTLNTMQGGQRQPFVQRHIDTRVRRLMPIECERLMSWPDDWTRWGSFDGEVKEISDTQRYKMCGNGVVSAVIKEIINEM